MRILFSILFAGIVVRLKPTVTALLQHPLQRFRELAPSGDASNLKTPPSHLRPLTPARRHVLTGCLLLTLGLLTVLAPPVESHYPEVHSLHGTRVPIPHSASGDFGISPNHTHQSAITKFFGGELTAIHPKHFEIRWIRIYKNPKTTKLGDPGLNEVVGGYEKRFGFSGASRVPSKDVLVNHVINPIGFGNRRARLFPSLWTEYKQIVDGDVALDNNYFWVDINPDNGELYPDDVNHPGNTGLVTATENTRVVPGDRVAIAINVKLTYYKAVKEWGRTGNRAANDLPLTDGDGNVYKPGSDEVWARNYAGINDIAGGSIVAAVGIPGVGILNPNYPLERIHIDGQAINDPTGDGQLDWFDRDGAVTHREWGHEDAHGYHTIVYQFEVTDAHVSLNALADRLGGWLDGGPGNVNPFNVPYNNVASTNYEFVVFDPVYPEGRTYAEIQGMHGPEFGFAVPFGASTADGGNRWCVFMNPAQFIAGAARAPYLAYPDSADFRVDDTLVITAIDNDPGVTAQHVRDNSQIDKQYTAGVDISDRRKSGQYRSDDTYSEAEATELSDPSLHGIYKRGEKSATEAESWPFTLKSTDLDRNGDGLIDYIPIVDDIVNYVAPDPLPTNPNQLQAVRDNEEERRTANGRVRHFTVSAGFYSEDRVTFPHYFPPTYDTAKGRIYYPRVVVEFQRVTPEIVDVPTETQTGDPFQVTLSFARSDENVTFRAVALEYDESDAFLTSLQAALTAAFEHAAVTQVERLDPRDMEDKSVRYQVTVVPSVLGVIGEMTLRVPADTVVDMASELGNAASAAVTVPFDTSLQLVSGQSVEVVEPASGAYQAGDEIVVRVPLETDGLTYEGENPPYVTIYLGEQVADNARHATWQKGEEQSGSTIVPFVYVLQASDPSGEGVIVKTKRSESDPPAEGVIVRLDSQQILEVSIPRGTELMFASGSEHAGTDEPAVGPGEAAPVSDTPSEGLTFDVPVTPVIYLPPDDTVSKAVASTVPRSPIVFNELGNGSGDTNDWLELRNVSGSDVSLKDWELSIVADGKKEDTSLIVFPDVSVPANGLLLITNSASDKTPLAGGQNKGLSHASLVDAGLSLPDDGKFLLILRNATEKLGLDEAFIDVAGGGGSDTDAFIRDETGDYDTHVWPLQVLEAPGDATEDALSSGKVWQRAKADLIGYHRDAWAEAAFTGIGYDRKVTQSAATAGTPGYPNGALKTEASTPKGAVTISEIMFDSEGGTLPQWIELYNKSKTEALNLNRWKLEIQNRNSPDLVGRPIVTLTLQEKVIQPNQTLLIVAGTARASSADVFPEDRVYNLFKLHEKNLRIKTPRDTFLSGEGFYLKLSDRNGTKIDEVGNIDDNRRTDDAPVWVWPTNLLGRARSSVVRRYDKGTAVARDGMVKSSWALAGNFNKFKVESLHYGHADDIGTPGYRKGGALPVELSTFTVNRTDAGPVIVTWTTESEVDNAGFNLRRSLKRESGFTLLNPVLIAGAGTTGERQTYTFTDTSAKPGVEYYYQIEEVSLGGRPETLRTRRLPGPVSPTNRSLTTFGEVKQRE